MSYLRSLVYIFSLFFSVNAIAINAELEAKTRKAVKIFSEGDYKEKRKMIGEITWAGISDPEVYDPLEKEVLEYYQKPIKAKPGTRKYKREKRIRNEKIAWLLKGLALSGNRKYVKTIETFIDEAKSLKIKQHGKNALKRIYLYEKWNPIINQNVDQALPGNLEKVQIKNMLSSEYINLKQTGAKKVHFALFNDLELLRLAESKLLEHHKKVQSDQEVVMLAWMCKALAKSLTKGLALSEIQKYTQTIEAVIAESNSLKLRAKAERALKRLHQYKKWNSLINRNIEQALPGKLEEFRVKNMLSADDFDLKRIGAKKVYLAFSNNLELLEVVKKELLKHYKDIQTPTEIDALTWMCRTLGAANLDKYHRVLNEVAKNTNSRKVRNWVREIIEKGGYLKDDY